MRGVVGISSGLLSLLITAVAVVSDAVGLLALLGLWSIASGTFEIAAAVRLRREIYGEWLMVLSGILSILLGIATALALIFYPAAAMLSSAVMTGIYAVAAGMVLIALGFRLRRRRGQHLSM
jgi:uncharacterized membrane protein HdeD (DUF308 family)